MEKSINIGMINDCIAGNRQAQRRLYDMLMPFLNMTCRRYLNDQASTQDVLQETFLSIFTNLRQFDPAKSALKTWATRIAINFCLKNNAKHMRESMNIMTSYTLADSLNISAHSMELFKHEFIMFYIFKYQIYRITANAGRFELIE